MSEGTSITELLTRAQRGDEQAWNQALPLVYNDLRRIASAHFRKESRGQVLQPTALVHEAWLKLVRARSVSFENRVHFFSFCSRLMRQVLIDEARRRKCKLESEPFTANMEPVDATALDEALAELAKLSPRQCEVVEMRYFGGLSIDEIAGVLGLSSRTVKRDWLAARTWLFQYLQSP